MTIEVLNPTQWEKVSEATHLVCFSEHRPRDLDRVDFAMVVSDGDMPVAYMTVKEHDAETVYLQHGGRFPHSLGAGKSLRAYVLMLNRLSELGYERANTLIENTNTAMQKVALKVGWKITGTRFFDGKLLVENSIEFKDMEV